MNSGISPIRTTDSLGAQAQPGGSAHAELAGVHTPLYFNLVISDPEVITAAKEYPEGRARADFIQTALKIGVLSLRAARGVVDGDTIRREGDSVLTQLSERLEGWRRNMEQQVTSNLTHYFDPKDGKFTERVNRLVTHDGELATVMRGQVKEAETALGRVFEQFIGENSKLLKALDPTGENQLVVTMQRTLDAVIHAQNAAISSQFSLDQPDSALSRLVRELEGKHGNLNDALSKRMGEMIDEFSLDKDDSALSKLVRRVDLASKAMTSEFSLDNDVSAISRLQKLIVDNHGKQMLAVNEVVQQLKTTIESLQVRREEAAKGTQHGLVFEQDVGAMVRVELEAAGDIMTECGSTTGIIPNCKVGDHVITLSPDSAAAGARIVVECKEKSGVTLQDSLAEAHTARNNRQAGLCIYVHSEKTAHASIPTFQRFGHDIVMRWNAEDPTTDLFLRAALMVAKALSVRAAQHQSADSESFNKVEAALLIINKQMAHFDEIMTFATSGRTSAEKIHKRAELMRDEIAKQLNLLIEEFGRIKTAEGDAE
jgi:hypothetical protein